MAISIAVHLAVFLAIGLIVPRPAFQFIPQEKPITIALLPPLPPTRTHRTRRSQAAEPPVPQPNRVLPLPLPRVHTPVAPPKTAPPSPVPAPSAPAPGPSAAEAKPGAGSIAPGPLPADESPRGVQALLRRSVGCDVEEAAHLTHEEKEACAKRFGDMARKAQPFSAIPDDKRGAYSVQAAADAHRRAMREDGLMKQVVPCEGQGSNFDTGCLPDSAIMHFKQH